jgi:hypothetical protein
MDFFLEKRVAKKKNQPPGHSGNYFMVCERMRRRSRRNDVSAYGGQSMTNSIDKYNNIGKKIT